MSRTPEIVDFDLIHQWRQNGRSFRWIGRALARMRLRSTDFQAASVQAAYYRWLDEQGIEPPAEARDLRHQKVR